MNFLTVSILVAAAVACAACSTTEYVISTKEGHMLQSKGKPELDDKNGMYMFKDTEGRKATIRKDEVVEIIQR